MATKLPLKINEFIYDAAGLPVSVLSIYDFHRFKWVIQNLLGKSVLDIGTHRADFLNSIKASHEITGIDVNMERVKYGNHILGQDAIKLGNLDIGLEFKDNSFDTVTCMEVLEHLEDPKRAIAELVRVSRNRVIITVPFDETIQEVLCIHCAKYTPLSGHIHSFSRKTIRDIIPNNVRIIKTGIMSNKGLRLLPYIGPLVFKSPLFIISFIDGLANLVLPKAAWMVIVLDKNNTRG